MNISNSLDSRFIMLKKTVKMVQIKGLRSQTKVNLDTLFSNYFYRRFSLKVLNYERTRMKVCKTGHFLAANALILTVIYLYFEHNTLFNTI